MKKIESAKQRRQALYLEEKNQAEVRAEELAKASCTIDVEVNELEKLYGSVTPADISAALKSEGFDIDKDAIVLAKPIEELGVFDATVNLHDEVKTNIRAVSYTHLTLPTIYSV